MRKYGRKHAYSHHLFLIITNIITYLDRTNKEEQNDIHLKMK